MIFYYSTGGVRLIKLMVVTLVLFSWSAGAQAEKTFSKASLDKLMTILEGKYDNCEVTMGYVGGSGMVIFGNATWNPQTRVSNIASMGFRIGVMGRSDQQSGMIKSVSVRTEDFKKYFFRFNWANIVQNQGTLTAEIQLFYSPEKKKYETYFINNSQSVFKIFWWTELDQSQLEQFKLLLENEFKAEMLKANAPYKMIGKQNWAKKNLDVAVFSNGDSIPQAQSPAEWQFAAESKQPAWCYYDNDSTYRERYGKLYNWYAVKDARGLCPSGWHMPSDLDWTTLTKQLGGETQAGTKMKSKEGWSDSTFPDDLYHGNGSNESGFNGLPGGYCKMKGAFTFLSDYGIWWSSTEFDGNQAWYRSLSHKGENIARFEVDKSCGLSVRCIKN